MNLEDYFNSEAERHLLTFEATRQSLAGQFENLVALALKSVRNDGKVLFFGNGGSASDAQHLATELAIRYISDRDPIAAIALNTDTSAITAATNDIGFDQVFSRQIEAIGKPEDLAIGISTSGKSPNVLRALKSARGMGMATAGFTGKTGGEMASLCDALIHIPSDETARIQEMHILIGHMLCGALEIELGLVETDDA